jgi:mannose-6-phosphate isomerase-like protein (cupin superfamily)
MATILNPSDLTLTRLNGVTRATLANRDILGSDALHIERIALDPRARTLPAPASDAERFLYVARGAGLAYVGSKPFPLEPESILWLEPGDTFSIEAGLDKLEVLVCQAPASPPTPWPSGRGGG